jgi:hypothetical protein
MRLEVVGHWGGPSEAVAAAGQWAVLGEGNRVLVLDVSDPASPRLVGRSDDLGAPITSLSLVGQRVVVGAGDAGLHILDVSLPFAPIEMGRWRGGPVRDVAVAGMVAYVLDGTGRLVMVDIGNPAAMRDLGRSDAADFREVAVAGGTAWLAGMRGPVVAVDVRDPNAPSVLSLTAVDDWIGGLAAGDGWMSIGHGDNVNLYDVTAPAFPRLLGTRKVGFGVTDGVIVDRKLYVISGPRPVLILELRAGLLMESTRLEHEGTSADIAVDGERIYLAISPRLFAGDPLVNGLAIARGSQMLGTYAGFGPVLGVAVRNGLAYVAAGRHGVQVWDTSYLPRMSPAGQLRTNGEATGLNIEGQTMVVADTQVGLLLADLATPAAPRVVTFTGSGRHYTRVKIVGGVVYAIEGTSPRIIDIRTPGAPGSEQWLDGIDIANDLDIDDSALYIAGRPEVAILPFDGAGKPGTVTPVSFGPLSFGGVALHVDGSRVAAMHVVDRCMARATQTDVAAKDAFADPKSTPAPTPTQRPTFTPTPQCPSLSILHDQTPGPDLTIVGADPKRPITMSSMGDFVVANVNGITVWDVSNATGPQTIASSPIGALDLTVADGLLFAGAGLDGLYVLRLVPADAATATPTRRGVPRVTSRLWLPSCGKSVTR